MSLSHDDVAKLALLARLELSTEEIESVRPQLDSILGFVDKLAQLDTDDIEPMRTALDVDNCWRADEPVISLDRKQALLNSPSTDGKSFLVPPVLGAAGAKQ